MKTETSKERFVRLGRCAIIGAILYILFMAFCRTANAYESVIDTIGVDTVGWERICDSTGAGYYRAKSGGWAEWVCDSSWQPILHYTLDTTYRLNGAEIGWLEKMPVPIIKFDGLHKSLRQRSDETAKDITIDTTSSDFIFGIPNREPSDIDRLNARIDSLVGVVKEWRQYQIDKHNRDYGRKW